MYSMMVCGILKLSAVSLGESGINLFTISFLGTRPLPSLRELATLSTHHKVNICIGASYAVLASCVIEVSISIGADDETTWLSALGGQLWPAVRDRA